MKVDILDKAVINTWLLTLEGKSLGIIPNGAVGIDGNRIVFVGKTHQLNLQQIDDIIDRSNHITMPGLINAHAHTGLTLLRGAAQDIPEIEWMNKGIGPISKHLTPEDIEIGSKLAVLEGIRSGTTTFVEFTRNVARIVNRVYLPFKTWVVACETINEVPADRSHYKPNDIYPFDQKQGIQSLNIGKDLVKKFQDGELVECALGPQALDMISLDTLREIFHVASKHQINIHMHIAQGRRERLQIQGRYGKKSSTVSVLDENKFLSGNLVAIHIHDTTLEEKKRLIKHKVSMVGCPTSISVIDGIIPPLAEYLSLGGKCAIGTDQAPGPNNFNMFNEMRMASILSKLYYQDPTKLPPWRAIHLVTSIGADVLGLSNKIGKIKVGYKADLITLDLNSVNFHPIVTKPFYNFIPNLLYATTGSEVKEVMINGEFVLREGKFSIINEEKVLSQANVTAQKLFDRATEDWRNAGSKMVEYHDKGML
jgi:5-methylthioadenosine/S-adenosylhomocysteine deaminase